MEEKYTLSCLIPIYQEGEKVIKPLLDSIALQQNVDFNQIEAVITHDGIIPEGADYKLSDEFINSYPFHITYLQKEHAGVSAARNYCFDHCSGKYVSWMDCDDMFFNMCGLWIFFEELKKGDVDVYTSKFVEETHLGPNGSPFYMNRENDSTFVHGKFLRSQFLIDNKIRWNEKLTIHEDSYLNCLTQQLAAKIPGRFKYCPTAFYLWKWRDNSVCRHDPLYINKTYVNMYESNTALVHEFEKRGEGDAAMSCVVNMIYESYFNFNSDKWWTEEGNPYLLPTEKRFKQYWKDFNYLFEATSKKSKLQIISKIRNKYYSQGLLYEKTTFEDWIKHIEELED